VYAPGDADHRVSVTWVLQPISLFLVALILPALQSKDTLITWYCLAILLEL